MQVWRVPYSGPRQVSRSLASSTLIRAFLLTCLCLGSTSIALT